MPTDPAGVSERRIITLGKIAATYEKDDHPRAFDRALDAAYDAGRAGALRTAPVLELAKEALERIRAISSKPTYPGNNLRDIDSIARAALQTIGSGQ